MAKSATALILLLMATAATRADAKVRCRVDAFGDTVCR